MSVSRVSFLAVTFVLATALVVSASALVCCSSNDDGVSLPPPDNGTPEMQPDRVTIMHTNDMHSHFLGSPNADYTPLTPGDDDTVGGIARVAAKVKEVRAERALEGVPCLLLDAGDFSMGTLFHLLEGEAEMGVMNLMGYDAVTLGNHEFDWLPLGAATIAGHAAGLPVVASNMEITDTADPGGEALQDLIDAGAILTSKVLTLANGLKVGLFGVMGEDADGVIFRPDPDSYPVVFTDRIAAATAMVAKLRNEDGVDLVVCISHSGVDDDNHAAGEDPELAAAVPDIDVIISGHTHTTMPEPVIVGGTVIVQARSYTQRLGVLDLRLTEDGVEVVSYEYDTIDDTIPGDAQTQTLVQQYMDRLDTEVLGPMGYAFNSPIAETTFDLVKVYGEEHTLGNLVTDAIRYSVDDLLADPEEAVDFAVESNGVIRDGILAGAQGLINTSDAFRVVPLGLDPFSGTAGYPMLTFYLYGEDIHKACLVDTFAPLLNNSDYWLSYSGLRFQHASLALLDVWQCNDGDDPACADRTPVENNQAHLYKVAVNYYVALNIESMADLSGGLIVVTPRDENGDPLASLADAILYKSPGVPLTQWEGFLDYLASFPDTDSDGIPNIPARYAAPEGRIVDVCFVATAAYGTPFEKRIDVLRDFRDRVLAKSDAGRALVDLYYAHGESLAEPVAQHGWLRLLVRVLLLPVLGLAKSMLWLL